MTKSFLYHLQINVLDREKSFPFYKELLAYFDYKIIYEGEFGLGMSNGTTDLWFMDTGDDFKEKGYHRKSAGLNHLAFGLESKELVERFIEDFLKPRGIRPLYDSPRHYPEYEEGYFAVFFEDPDRIKLEVTYKPGFEKKMLS